ncbi:DUF2125 domain-containing protein [Paracoccus sp. 11-3]|uniref:DUF2125 domain-containing protein n=1 Tax=Paracoccus amoyensis TaxID=2760093 RepID=A0A926GAC9_9RHOB|nr:DUF2125 domain-containing protein [Paracoccus amoyensis]MBC9246276.1 DUF2125 domain-containing protein [Paracoccus amoyensis]
MFRSLATSAIALIAGAAPVLADITPAEAWESLTKNYTDFGYELTTGNVDDAGNTLTVTDAVLSMNSAQGPTTITIPKMIFTETGDAKVRGVMEGDIALSVTYQVPDEKALEEAMNDQAGPAPTDGAEGETTPEESAEAPAEEGTAEDATSDMDMVDVQMTGKMTAPNNEMLISGSVEDTLYEYNYPSMVVDLQVPVDQESDVTMPIKAEITDLKGTQRNVKADGTEQTFDLTAAMLAIGSDWKVPANGTESSGGDLTFNIAFNNLASKGNANTPSGEFDLGTQMAEALAAGMNFDATAAYESIAGTFKMNAEANGPENPAKNAEGMFSAGSGDISFKMSSDGITYGGKAADTKVEMSSSDLPFPITYAIKETSGDIAFPVQKGNEAQPFTLAYALSGLTMGDEIWALFDPNGALPRDPASLSIDVQGDALVTMNIFDPALSQPQVDASGMPIAPPVPFEPKNLKINRVALDAVGAKADLVGDLDFSQNPNDPTGKINGTFEGVNGLLDNLVKTGLVPQDQLMGMRMMLGMFAKPVEGETDKLQTEIEFQSGGKVFANGQQIK